MTGIGCRSLKLAALRTASALILGMAVIAGPAAAQTAPPAATPPSATPMPEALADGVEIRIAELHRALHIMPSQEALFDAYADAIRSNAQAMHALFVRHAQSGDFSAPAQLRRYAELTAAHADAINKLIAPLDALYQVLSPEQRQAADRHFQQLRQQRTPR